MKLNKHSYVLYGYSVAVYCFFVYIQSDKFFGAVLYLGTSYYVSPDEVLYLQPGVERIARLVAVFRGELADFNINVFALLSDFFVNVFGAHSLLILNGVLYFLFIYIVVTRSWSISTKYFIVLNPVLPYLATSILRDLLIYVLLLLTFSLLYERRFLVAALLSFLLLLLRPLVLILVMLYSVKVFKGFSKFFVGILALSITSLLSWYIVSIKGVPDLKEVVFRVFQLFGFDFLSKSNADSFANTIDLMSSVFVFLCFAIIAIILSVKLKIKSLPMLLFVGVLFYSFIYASYLGFFVARTIFPLYLFAIYYIFYKRINL